MAEIPYETTLLVRDTCLCFAAQRAARALARRFDGAFRPLDLTNGQFSLLMSLNRPNPPTISSVAEFLAMDRTTLTAALKPLLRRELVRVTVDPNDQRGRLLRLTRKGRGLLAAAVPVWKDQHRRLEKMLARDSEKMRDSLNLLSRSAVR
jgi:DNA-binding MarR family transcriptional regulator